MATAKAPLFVQSAMLPAKQLELTARVALWRESAKKLAEAVEEERVNRQYLVDNYFPNFEEGTHTGSLSDGYNLKCEMRINRSVDQEQYAAAEKYAASGWVGAPRLRALLDRVFRPKIELNLKEWKSLDPKEQRSLADLVVEKPGMPSMKYEEKKR